MNTSPPKMTRAQALHLAAIARLGAKILTKTVVADGRLSVLYEVNGRRTRSIMTPEGEVTYR